MCRQNYDSCSFCSRAVPFEEEKIFSFVNHEGIESTAGYIYCISCGLAHLPAWTQAKKEGE